ncbi:hypothetical protein Ppa06_45560 [Planomonospora parontospora subsp. parontospora]|uniref:Uncharacterized protein n=2 Tax=Planomonospora parontospora TaxID=58119 RepID=A0AA37BKR3_9ACTN|nr:hypothetical protein GCM10010126_51430 [Planomonospora parontospora]GII10758.1 hypothetical protein Ppa06_45560 [Planomonospora parontospora subsp. parontospora]
MPQPEETTTNAADTVAMTVRRARVDVFDFPMPDDATRIWKVHRPDREVPWRGNVPESDRINGWTG